MKRETLASVFKIGAAVLLIAVLAFVIVYQNRKTGLGSRIEIFKGDGEDSRGIEGYSLGRTMPFGGRALLVTTNTMLLLDEKGRSEALDISLSDPEISSVDTKIEALCAATVKSLMRILKGETDVPKKTVIAAEFIQRQTTEP